MTQSQPALVILSQGPDRASAEALARACGLEGVQGFDAALLDQALSAGQRCVVVWSDPPSVLAAALREGSAPTQTAALWTRLADQLLARPSLILIEAAALQDGARDLALPPDLLPPAPPTPGRTQDTADVLAHLMLPHLPGLTNAWHRLRAASLAATLPPNASADLDSLADLGPTLQRAVQERDILRDQLQALATITDAPPAPQDEITLLRDQLLALSSQPPNAATPPAPSEELTLLRDQLLAVTALLGSSGPPPASAALTEELRLLRDHLHYLQSDLDLGGAVPTPTLSGPAPAGFEAAIARLLADLVQETDRRILAEREAHAARKTLRHLGVEPPGPQSRSAVSARPRTP